MVSLLSVLICPCGHHMFSQVYISLANWDIDVEHFTWDSLQVFLWIHERPWSDVTGHLDYHVPDPPLETTWWQSCRSLSIFWRSTRNGKNFATSIVCSLAACQYQRRSFWVVRNPTLNAWTGLQLGANEIWGSPKSFEGLFKCSNLWMGPLISDEWKGIWLLQTKRSSYSLQLILKLEPTDNWSFSHVTVGDLDC